MGIWKFDTPYQMIEDSLEMDNDIQKIKYCRGRLER